MTKWPNFDCGVTITIKFVFMKKSFTSVILLIFIAICVPQLSAQISSSSSNLVAQPIPDRTVYFNLSDTGIAMPITWGLDLAWLSETNIRRGISFMGKERVDIVRSSFIPTSPIHDGKLQGEALTNTNLRMNIIQNNFGTDMQVVLNCDHPSVDDSYAGNARNWAELIDVTTQLHQNRGFNVIAVSPFNEPDYGWGQGSIDDFYNIIGELNKIPRFDSIRISGGNTLNCDEALPWYNHLNPAGLTEGNTHQLAGSFDNYASFFQAVRGNGDHATADELHNVMEAMVGVEYGMQTGIWWGTAELARGEFVKASDGVRIGYAEHRDNWTAASVYRTPEGKIQAFGGTSERQAVSTTFRFVSKDRDVYYDGYGPQREFLLEMPGGTGYQQGQTNAEKVMNITWGDDIQPVIDGKYIIVNRKSGKVMEVASGSKSAGANLRQNNYKNLAYQQWNVNPVDARIGGDFSYFSILNVNSKMAPDVNNFSLDNGGNIIQWDNPTSTNEQWYLEYSEDGWFFIRNRHSSQCMEVANSSTSAGANIQQWKKDGAPNQQWRFIPVGTPIEFDAPRSPVGLTAIANAESVKLEWNANTETDVAGYNIYRSESIDGAYNTISRNVNTTTFVDNSVIAGAMYFYKIKAIDISLNSSDYSLSASATATGANTLVARLQFEDNTMDSSINLNHSAAYGDITYVQGEVGSKAAVLDGLTNFIQLPATIANHQEITISTWVYWKGTSSSQYIFDFGNNRDEKMYLSPNVFYKKLRFGIKNGAAEQRLESTALPTNEWLHVAVTLGDSHACLYVNGELVDESTKFTISPIDIKPVLNYIGRGQSGGLLFNGNVDDFRVYNYALSADEITQLIENPTDVEEVSTIEGDLSVWPVPANEVLHVNYFTAGNNLSAISILDMNGREVMRTESNHTFATELNVSGLQAGIYILKLTSSETSVMKKILIKH